jgi:hypothetical protein
MRVEISSDHGIEVHDLPAVPMVGDYLRVSLSDYSPDDAPMEQRVQEARDGCHGDERVERVRYVIWHFEPTLVVTVDTDCVAAP